MSTRKILVCTGPIAVGVVLVTLMLAANAAPEVDQAAAPFQGPVLAISFKSDPESGAYLQEAAVWSLGGESFLVGTYIDSGLNGGWTVGRRVWVAIDDIAQIVEFASAEELRAAFGRP